jgi:PTH1 family peptidyl-tRNA hydrolase
MPFWKKPAEEGLAPSLWLVVGLGNPGREYAGTRHNVGFMVVDTLARRHGLTFKRSSKHRAETARGRIGETPAILALPLTYMNQSGIAVSRLLSYYAIPLDRLLVVCDDLDIPFGTLRLRPRGSSGGNGGLKSIIGQLGSEEFARLRVGVGRPEHDAVGHVLGAFSRDQIRSLPVLLETTADAVTVALNQGVPTAMNDYNRDWLPSLRVS